MKNKLILCSILVIAGIFFPAPHYAEAQLPFEEAPLLEDSLHDAPLLGRQILAQYPYIFVKWSDDEAANSMRYTLYGYPIVKNFAPVFSRDGTIVDELSRIDRITLNITTTLIEIEDETGAAQSKEVISEESVFELQSLVKDLKASGAVEWIEAVKTTYFPMAVEPNDYYWGRSGAWGQDYLDLWGLDKIEAANAWEITTGHPDVIVAVVDTGIDYQHAELKDRVWINPAEDINQNGKADFEQFSDYGIDGLRSFDEEEFDLFSNPDPAGDDYDPDTNPLGTEGNARYDLGEPFLDYGMDRILDPDNPDPGEGDGIYNVCDVPDPLTCISDIDFIDNDGYILNDQAVADDLLGWDFAAYAAVREGRVRLHYDPDPIDGIGHGTHVSGTIGAAANNEKGIVGINWRSPILTAQGFGRTGGATTEGLAQAIVYAVDMGARVVNNSWGGIENSRLIEEAIDYAYSKEVPLVFASGNFHVDSTNMSPQRNNKLIIVNSSSHEDTLSAFSDFGVNTDVAAPGGGLTRERAEAFNILSALAADSEYADPDFYDGQFVVDPDGKYLRAAGTSMAAPHVTGVVSLVQSQYESMLAEDEESRLRRFLKIEEIRQILRYSADDDTVHTGWDPDFGYGRLNAYQALQMMQGDPWPGVPVAYIARPPTRDNLSFYEDKRVPIEAIVSQRFGGIQTSRLEYGKGQMPEEWFPILSWVTGRRVPLWDASELEEGVYTIRLVVEDDLGRIFEDRVLFTISYPFLNENWPKEIVSINHKGATLIEDLVPDSPGAEIIFPGTEGLYVLTKDGQAPAGTAWPVMIEELPEFADDDNIRLAHLTGNVAIGDFDTTYPGKEILATITYITKEPREQIFEIYVFHSDGSVLRNEHWPSGPIGPEPGPSRGSSVMILEDYNLDGTLDLLIAVGKSFQIFDFSGNDIAPAELKNLGRSIISERVSVGDINALDDYPEIVNFRREKVYAYNVLGEVVLELNVSDFQDDHCSVQNAILVNIDADHDLEIAVVCYSYSLQQEALYTSLLVFNGDGTLAEGEWPYRSFEFGDLKLFRTPNAKMAVGDLDRDGSLEILYSASSSVHIVNQDGTPYRDPLIAPAVESGISVGPVDEDRYPDIVANSIFSFSTTWNKDGLVLDGWPVLTDEVIMMPSALGDVDNDGDLEIVFVASPLIESILSSKPFQIHVIDGKGKGFSPWPMHRGNPYSTNAFANEWIRGDVNGDGKVDVIDAILLLRYLFLAEDLPVLAAADANSDGAIDIADVLYILFYVFKGGPEPAQPFPIGTQNSPVISNVTSLYNSLNDGTVSITWQTDKVSDSKVYYGTNVPLAEEQSLDAMVRDHRLILDALVPNEEYLFAVESKGPGGNITYDDNQGNYYRFQARKINIADHDIGIASKLSLTITLESLFGSFEDVTGVLRSGSDFLEMIDDTAEFGDIAEGEGPGINLSGPFTFTTATEITDETPITLYVDIFAEGDFVETVVINDFLEPIFKIPFATNPDVSGSIVVWEWDDNVYAQDLTGVLHDGDPLHIAAGQDPAIDGTLVVYRSPEFFSKEVYAVDLSGQLNGGQPIHVNEGRDNFVANVTVSGTIVGWTQVGGYVRDLSGAINGGEMLRLSIGGVDDISGMMVTHASGSRIWAQDLSGNLHNGFAFTVMEGVDTVRLAAIDGSIVTWATREEDDYNVYVKDIAGILNNGDALAVFEESDDLQLDPDISEGIVVWQDAPYIAVRDLTGQMNNGEAFAAYINEIERQEASRFSQVKPAISGRFVVWAQGGSVLGRELP